MTELEDPKRAKDESTTTYHAELVDRPRPKLDGSLAERLEHHVFEEREHRGRMDGGREHVLRPSDPRLGLADTVEAHALETQRGDLYAAAHRARIAAALVRTYGASGARDRARDEATQGVRDVIALLDASGLKGTGPDSVIDDRLGRAFADAYANCAGLSEAIGEVFEDAAMDVLARQCRAHFAALPRPKDWNPPPTKARREAVARAQSTEEAESMHLAISGRLHQARVELEQGVVGYARRLTTLDPEAGRRSVDELKGPVFFKPAALRAAALIRETAISKAMRHAIRGTDEHVRAAAHGYWAAAQRFVDWALAGEQPLVEVAHVVVEASEPLSGWIDLRPLSTATTHRTNDAARQFDRFEQKVFDVWDRIFDKQAEAVGSLATDPEPGEHVRWDERLFAMITNAALSFLIGGPAGAAGSVAQDLVSQGKGAVAGGLGNGIESIVTSVLTDVITMRASAPSGQHVRKRFYEQQAAAIGDAGLTLRTSVLPLVVDEARRRPDGAAVLDRMSTTLFACLSTVETRQKTRSVQDWALYQALIAHGRDARSGSVDMAGVGRDAPTHDFASRGPVPTGVLEVELVIEGANIRLARASAGGLRSDELVYLEGTRLRELAMPVRYVITEHLAPAVRGGLFESASIVVNRNDKGVCWLRSVEGGGREMIARFHRRPPPDDGELLRAAAAIITSMGHTPLPKVDA